MGRKGFPHNQAVTVGISSQPANHIGISTSLANRARRSLDQGAAGLVSGLSRLDEDEENVNQGWTSS